jgi:hypothetical protein
MSEESLVSFLFGWLVTREKDYWSIRASAKRLQIRDKGQLEAINVTKEGCDRIVHTSCNTPIRIGIKSDGSSVQYCWRCERIEGTNGNDAPVHRTDITSRHKASKHRLRLVPKE